MGVGVRLSLLTRLMPDSTLHSLGGGELGLGQLQGVGILEAVRVHVLAHVQRCIDATASRWWGRERQESETKKTVALLGK